MNTAVQASPRGRRSTVSALAVLALFVSIPAATPIARAQAAPVSQQQSVNSKLHADDKDLHKEEKEAEQNNVYRHSATVRWVANLLHTDVETTAKSFEYINFIVLLLCIFIPLGRLLPRVFKKRSDTLSAGLEQARKATADAGSRLSAVEAKLASLDTEIAAIRKQVEQEIAQDEQRVKASIEEERLRVVSSAEQEIQAASDLAQRELRHFAASLAIDHATGRLVVSEEQDRTLIADFSSSAKQSTKPGGQS